MPPDSAAIGNPGDWKVRFRTATIVLILVNGIAERFIRTLKEECIHLHDVETVEEAREVIGPFIERYNNGWLLQRHGYLTPARAREKLSRRAA